MNIDIHDSRSKGGIIAEKEDIQPTYLRSCFTTSITTASYNPVIAHFFQFFEGVSGRERPSTRSQEGHVVIRDFLTEKPVMFVLPM